MKIPYGTADFAWLRQGGFFYVDKTRFIPRLEDARLGRKNLLFLRPRRFGKSTLVSMLHHYYDIARADAFAQLFAGLAIAECPTAERSRYLVLRLDFAGLTTDQGIEGLRHSFISQLRNRLSAFFAGYQQMLPALHAAWERNSRGELDPADLMAAFTEAAALSPHPVYLLIDEFDNFANDLVAQGRHDLYCEVLHATGFVREFYKRVKTAADNGVIVRIFMTGVSPVMLTDMTSGFNIVKSITQHEDFHDLCGFSHDDVARLLDGVVADRGLRLDRDRTLSDLRRYYDGYRFSTRSDEPLYNPDMVLHFMSELSAPDRYPEHLLDPNVRTDYGRLHRMIFDERGQPRERPAALLQQLIAEGEIRSSLHDVFRLDEIYDDKYFASYLYYLGLVTLDGPAEPLYRLRVPNLAIQLTYGEALDRILRALAGVRVGEDRLGQAIGAMAYQGEIGAFCDLLYGQVIRHLSNRDLIRLDERGLKVLVLGYLGLVDVFHPFSEMEMGRGYGDLVLLLNRRYQTARYSFLIELKYVKETEGPPAQERTRRKGARRKKGAAALRKEVEAQFTEAEAQLRRYLKDPRLQGLAGPGGWKAASMVQVGTSALYYRLLDQPTGRAAAE
jgi:hypothetical protein